jgi:hypothetical protein
MQIATILESRMPRKWHVRFGGGRLEKCQQWQLASPLPYTIETEIVQLDLDRETEEETFAWKCAA